MRQKTVLTEPEYRWTLVGSYLSRCQTAQTLETTGLGVSGRSWEPQCALPTRGVEGRIGTLEKNELVLSCQVICSLCTVANWHSHLCSEPSRLPAIAYNIFEWDWILTPGWCSPITQAQGLLPCCPCWMFGFPEKDQATSISQLFAVSFLLWHKLSPGSCQTSQNVHPKKCSQLIWEWMASSPNRPALTILDHTSHSKHRAQPPFRKPVARLTQTSLYPVVFRVSACGNKSIHESMMCVEPHCYNRFSKHVFVLINLTG